MFIPLYVVCCCRHLDGSCCSALSEPCPQTRERDAISCHNVYKFGVNVFLMFISIINLLLAAKRSVVCMHIIIHPVRFGHLFYFISYSLFFAFFSLGIVIAVFLSHVPCFCEFNAIFHLKLMIECGFCFVEYCRLIIIYFNVYLIRWWFVLIGRNCCF